MKNDKKTNKNHLITFGFLPALLLLSAALSANAVSGTFFSSAFSTSVGNSITFTISAQDQEGVQQVCLISQTGSSNCKSCGNSLACSRTWEVQRTVPGTYTFTGYVYGNTSSGGTELNPTNPASLSVEFTQSSPPPSPVPSPSPLPASNDPVSGTLYSSASSVNTGSFITFTISAQDRDGVQKVCLVNQSGSPECQSCGLSSSCAKTWQVTQHSPGAYLFYGYAYGLTPAGAIELNPTNPSSLSVAFLQSTPIPPPPSPTPPPPLNDPVSGTLFASPQTNVAGSPITFTIFAQDSDGVEKSCLLNQSGSPECQSCGLSSSCTKTWQVTKNTPGTYTYQGYVYGKTPSGTIETNPTNPGYLSVSFTSVCSSRQSQQCSGDNLYWYNSCGQREELAQSCGAIGQICQGNQCVLPSFNVSCFASPSSAATDQPVTFSSSVSGGSGPYYYSWSGACSGSSSSCQTRFFSSGNYTANLNVTSGSQSRSASCSVYVASYPPSCQDECSFAGQSRCSASSNREVCGNYDSDQCLEWSFAETCSGNTSCGYGRCSDSQRPVWQCTGSGCDYFCRYDSGCGTQSQSYLSCFDKDVYWYNSQGARENKYQECGSNYYDNLGSNYCSGNNIYRQRTYYDRGCSLNACYSAPRTETQFVQTCGSGQICQSGQCVAAQECSSGACCESGRIKASSAICNVETDIQYGCPFGLGCGADVGAKSKIRYQYCSGTSPLCSGGFSNWGDWSSWRVQDACNGLESCVAGNSQCQPNLSCQLPPSNYARLFSKACYDGDSYWYDSNGQRQEKYTECQDNNACTTDSCSSGVCQNSIVCDGTTCPVSSQEYRQICSQDRGPSGFSIAILGKEDPLAAEWKEEFTAKAGTVVDFLIVVSNGTQNEVRDINVKTIFPSAVRYMNELKLDGLAHQGNIEGGIVIDAVGPQKARTITFKGGLLPGDVIGASQTEVKADFKAGEISLSDSVKILIENPQGALAAAGLNLAEIIKKWYFWVLVVAALALLVVFRGFILRLFGKE